MQATVQKNPEGQSAALWMSTIAFTVCFAVWTIFSIIGIQIKKDLGLNETQFGLLVGTPILTGSLIRIFLGIWTDQYGGRLVYTVTMLAAAVADADRGVGCRYCRRIIRGRHRLCVALVPGIEAGYGAGNFRRR
jgi:nitrate/nitrite transporter NarK